MDDGCKSKQGNVNDEDGSQMERKGMKQEGRERGRFTRRKDKKTDKEGD